MWVGCIVVNEILVDKPYIIRKRVYGEEKMASLCDWGCTLMGRMNISGVRWTKAIHHPYYFLLWHCGPKGVRRKRSDQPISNKSFLSWDTGREWQSVKRGRHQVIVSLSSLYPVSKLIWREIGVRRTRVIRCLQCPPLWHWGPKGVRPRRSDHPIFEKHPSQVTRMVVLSQSRRGSIVIRGYSIVARCDTNQRIVTLWDATRRDAM